jgi:preprotein translocase subunit SecF
MAKVIGIDLGTTNSCVSIMDGAKPKKGDSGFEEGMDMKGKDKGDMKDNKDDKDDKKDKSPAEKMYESLQNEIKQESSNRKSLVSSRPLSENLNGNTIQNTVKEYLNKSGIRN